MPGITPDEHRKAKFSSTEATQNPPNPYQQWLKPTSLCIAKVYVLFTGRQDEGIRTTFATEFVAPGRDDIAVNKGEFVTYIGEVYRRKVKDAWAPGGVRIEVAHQFLSARSGLLIADPAFFRDAFDEDVKDDGSV